MAEEPELIEQEEQDLYEHLRIVVDKGQSLLRIDKFLMHRVENASRNRIQNAIELGNVLVNDKSIKSSYKVKPQDIISVVLPHPPRDTEVYPENIPIEIVYEDDDVFAFDDISPQAPTHILICPRKHFAALHDASPEDQALLGKLQLVAAKLAKDRNLLGGYRTVFNNGAGASQSVFHLHLHLLGGRNFRWPPG